MEATGTAVITVSGFEANLIRIARCLVGRLPLAEGLPLLVRRVAAPRCLSRACVELLQDTLSKGCTERLARSGWQSERFLRAGEISKGRLWERRPAAGLGLTFSPETLHWLIWLTVENFADPRTRPRIDPARLTTGDRLLRLFALDALRDTLGAAVLVQQPGLRNDAMVGLMYPDLLAEQGVMDAGNIAEWLTEDRDWVLEALQLHLADRWEALESQKRQLADAEALRRLGIRQAQSLNEFLDAVEMTGRWDLTRFLLVAGERLLGQADGSANWWPRLDVSRLTMENRTALYRVALPFFRCFDRLAAHHRQAAGIGFADEGYRASQLWKSDWERLGGERLCEQARRLVRSFEPLPLAAAESGSAAVTQRGLESS